mmetsp:Transcript_138179/g.195597  ORF Transcript_138179/g.195597 Transcript_138179/m.195597 type:complete len:85 (+) Transcript_138179:40-294(+)
MMSFRTLIATLFLVAMANAFAPSASRPAFASKTALSFGFLKDLGIEKPSWLPDFGSEKSEDPAPAAVEEEDGEGEEGAEPAVEE